MAIKTCSKDGKPGFQCGLDGECHTYFRTHKAQRAEAKRKAAADCVKRGHKP